MSMFRRRHSGSSSIHRDNHDPERDPRTDASRDDADALDAWLNGIAPHNGSPDTRSGNGQQRPNVRTDDDDTESLAPTAARFHRRMETAQARDARAAGPDPQLWETIMEKTNSPTPAGVTSYSTAANPWTARPDSPPKARPKRPSQRARSRSVYRQRVWNTIANIALVAVILIAGFGLWRAYGEPGLPDGSDDPSTAPGLAMQPLATPGSTPATGESANVAAPPVATPQPTTDCDFSADIPIFNGVDESPWDGTAVLLTTSGKVVLSCPEEPEGTVLATTSGRTGISPLAWPGAVLVHDNIGDPETTHTRAVSLITGDSVEFGILRSESQSVGTQEAPGSPWLVGPAPNDTADVQILDLRTMQTRLLSGIAGTELPPFGGYLTSGDDTNNTLVLALQAHQHSTAGRATLVTEGLPGDLLVLNGSLDATTWISAPEDVPEIVGFKVSPDGKYVALHGASGRLKDRQHTYSIVRIDTGQEVARSETFTSGPAPGESVWTDSGLAYIDGNMLNLLPIDGDGTGETVFGGNGSLTDLRQTTDASTVLVNQEWSDDLATMVAKMQTPTFYTVNVTTGEAETLTGADVSQNTDPWPYPTRFLVTFDYQLEPRQSITYQVIDAVTGETVGTLDDVPLTQSGYEGYPTLGLRSVVSSADGETEIIAFDTQHIYLMTVVDGEPAVRQITSPEGLPGEYPLMAQMFLSPEGSLLSLTAQGDESRTRWLLPLDGKPDEWTAVENLTVGNDPGYIFFVPGTGD